MVYPPVAVVHFFFSATLRTGGGPGDGVAAVWNLNNALASPVGGYELGSKRGALGCTCIGLLHTLQSAVTLKPEAPPEAATTQNGDCSKRILGGRGFFFWAIIMGGVNLGKICCQISHGWESMCQWVQKECNEQKSC